MSKPVEKMRSLIESLEEGSSPGKGEVLEVLREGVQYYEQLNQKHHVELEKRLLRKEEKYAEGDANLTPQDVTVQAVSGENADGRNWGFLEKDPEDDRGGPPWVRYTVHWKEGGEDRDLVVGLQEVPE